MLRLRCPTGFKNADIFFDAGRAGNFVLSNKHDFHAGSKEMDGVSELYWVVPKEMYGTSGRDKKFTVHVKWGDSKPDYEKLPRMFVLEV